VSINDAAEGSIPRWRGDAGGWVIEGQPLSSPDLTLSSVAVSARCCGAFVNFSRRLRLSSAGDLQAAILRELQRQVRQALEHGLINGTGRNGEPLGLLHQGTGAVSFAGLVPVWSELMDMAEALADADGDLGNSVWMAHPSTAVSMAGTERVTGSGLFLVEMGAGASWTIAGLPLITSTAIPEGKVILLDRRAVVPVYFGPPQVNPDPFSGSKSITGTTSIVVMNYADIGVPEPALVIIGG
jgi:HK97 family phage major capsid protein